MKSIIFLITLLSINCFATDSFQIVQDAIKASAQTPIADSGENCSIQVLSETRVSVTTDLTASTKDAPALVVNRNSGTFFKSSESLCSLRLDSATSEIEFLDNSTLFFESEQATAYITLDAQKRISAVTCEAYQSEMKNHGTQAKPDYVSERVPVGTYRCMVGANNKNKLDKLNRLFH